MSKVSNTLLLLKVLESGKIYKISELAEILECSERTVRTYKEDLEKAGIYISTITGRHGGYYCNPTNTTNYFSFNKFELNILENFYLDAKTHNIETADTILGIIEKIRYQVILADKVMNNNEKNIDYSIIRNKYNTISNAINNGKRVKFMYQNSKNKNKQCILIPQNIYVHANNYFITGILENIHQIRTFNLNSINNIEII